MRKIRTFILMILVIGCFSGCTKYDDEDAVAEIFENGAAYIKMVSTSNNPYEIFIDDVSQGKIEGKKSKTYTVAADVKHEVHVKQLSGYSLWATTETYYITVERGRTHTKEFPESILGKKSDQEEK